MSNQFSFKDLGERATKLIKALYERNNYVTYSDCTEVYKVSYVVLMSNGKFGAITSNTVTMNDGTVRAINRPFAINELDFDSNNIIYLSENVCGPKIMENELSTIIYNESNTQDNSTVLVSWELENGKAEMYASAEQIEKILKESINHVEQIEKMLKGEIEWKIEM